MRFIDRAPDLCSLADDDPAHDAVAPQPVLLALAASARGQSTVRFCATNDPRGPTDHVSDLSLRVPHDTIRWTCLYDHKPLMMATNMVMLMRKRDPMGSVLVHTTTGLYRQVDQQEDSECPVGMKKKHHGGKKKGNMSCPGLFGVQVRSLLDGEPI